MTFFFFKKTSHLGGFPWLYTNLRKKNDNFDSLFAGPIVCYVIEHLNQSTASIHIMNRRFYQAQINEWNAVESTRSIFYIQKQKKVQNKQYHLKAPQVENHDVLKNVLFHIVVFEAIKSSNSLVIRNYSFLFVLFFSTLEFLYIFPK